MISIRSGNTVTVAEYRSFGYTLSYNSGHTQTKQLLAGEIVVFLYFVVTVTLPLQPEIVNMGDPSKFDPLELLTNKENRQSSFLSPFWNPMLGGVFGVGAALFSNWGIRKPVFSGKCAPGIAVT